jgi:hypothetical protein
MDRRRAACYGPLMFQRYRALVLSLGLCLAASVFSPAARAQDAEKALALELTKTVLPQSAYDAMLGEMLKNMGAMLPQQDAATMKKLEAALREVLPYQEMTRWNAELYGARFTSAELTELIKFYRTPLGIKLARALPEISGQAAKKAAEVLPGRLPAALKKHGLAP